MNLNMQRHAEMNGKKVQNKTKQTNGRTFVLKINNFFVSSKCVGRNCAHSKKVTETIIINTAWCWELTPIHSNEIHFSESNACSVDRKELHSAQHACVCVHRRNDRWDEQVEWNSFCNFVLSPKRFSYGALVHPANASPNLNQYSRSSMQFKCRRIHTCNANWQGRNSTLCVYFVCVCVCWCGVA